MLIEFCVQNHRAIRDKQTLSMIPLEADDIDHPDWQYHVAETKHPAVPGLLIDACIFGANGSGKTSLVAAMEFMVEFVRSSMDRGPDAKIPVEPFCHDSDWCDRPSEFEATFLVGTTAYRYGFEVTQDRVVGEWLSVLTARSKKWSVLIERERCSKSGDGALKLGKPLRDAGVDRATKTHPNAPLLSAAARLGVGGHIKSAYMWLAESFGTLCASSAEAGFCRTAGLLQEDEGKEKVLEFFRDFGIPLRDIWAEKRPGANGCALSGHAGPSRGSAPDSGNLAIFLLHGESQEAPAPIALDSEASGVRKLFNLAGPVLDALDRGSTLVLDEVNLGLHPHAVECLISMFCDRETNTKRAQVIFTSNNPAALNLIFAERDQVWLMEMKDEDQAARLKSLPYLEGSEGLVNFMYDYLQGQYGAIPNIRRQL